MLSERACDTRRIQISSMNMLMHFVLIFWSGNFGATFMPDEQSFLRICQAGPSVKHKGLVEF